jgi:hypothetical protein
MKQTLLVLGGALAGGILGYWAFFWIAAQGFYGLILPGGLLGLGAGLGKPRALWLPVACGLAATAIGLLAEWRFAPFSKNESLTYFLSHIHELKPITLIMIVAGGFVGFFVPFSCRDQGRRAGTPG